MVEIGSPVPNFQLPAGDGRTIGLSDFQGKTLVLYFYPKNNTPGCTMEGQHFRDAHPSFTELNTEIVGVSRDTVASHAGVAAKHCLPFPLLSDPKEELCNQFGVMKEKNMLGRKLRGISRSTFIINGEGVLVREFRGVDVEGHVDMILDAVSQLQD